VVRLFADVDRSMGQPEVVLYNPSARIRGELLSLDIGALATAQQAARRMLPHNRGSIFFTGATAPADRCMELGAGIAQPQGAFLTD